MARKVKDIVIPNDPNNRDKNKVFRITEMSAWDAERFAFKAFSAMAEAGVTLDENEGTLQDLVHRGLGSFLRIKSDKMTELMNELMTCVRVVPKPDTEPQTDRKLLPDDGYIEELSTLFKLRYETIMLHIDFFSDGESPTIAR